MYKGRSISAILLAAGSSSRMGRNKMLLRFGGLTPIQICTRLFSKLCDEIIIAYSPDTKLAAEDALDGMVLPVKLVSGGESRQESVRNSLQAATMEIVAIHDCARCLVTSEIILRSLDSAICYGNGIASVSVVDTLRNSKSGEIVDRTSLLAAQTPQSFDRCKLVNAYAHVNGSFTDDAALYRASGENLHYSEGGRENLKLTTVDDIALFNAILTMRAETAECYSEN